MIEIQNSSGELKKTKSRTKTLLVCTKPHSKRKKTRRGKPERPEGASGKPESSRAIHQQEAGKTTNKHDRRRTGKRGTGTQGERTTTADRNTDTGPPTQEVPPTHPQRERNSMWGGRPRHEPKMTTRQQEKEGERPQRVETRNIKRVRLNT